MGKPAKMLCHDDGINNEALDNGGFTAPNFSMPQEMWPKLAAFREAHKHGDMRPPTLGETETFAITPTGFGPIWVVQCNMCKGTEDLTDYDSW